MTAYIKSKKISVGVNKFTLSPILAGVLAMLTVSFSCSAQAQSFSADNVSLEKLMSVADSNVATVKLTEEQDLRSKALQEAAQSYGARAGLAHEMSKIQQVLLKNERFFDPAFSFDHLMMVDTQKDELDPALRARLVIPPVLVQSLENTTQDAPDTLRIVGDSVSIKEQSRFSLVKPTWRTYLLRDTASLTITPPHSTLLPKTDEEKAKYKAWVADGWKSGIAQGKAIFQADLARLDRDYQGMHLYMELLEQGKVSAPFVAATNQHVTGDANTLNIDDVSLKITVMPAFQQDSSKWTPVAK